MDSRSAHAWRVHRPLASYGALEAATPARLGGRLCGKLRRRGAVRAPALCINITRARWNALTDADAGAYRTGDREVDSPQALASQRSISGRPRLHTGLEFPGRDGDRCADRNGKVVSSGGPALRPHVESIMATDLHPLRYTVGINVRVGDQIRIDR